VVLQETKYSGKFKFGSEFVALHIVVDLIVSLRYKL
jgi:hypothetical protein